MQSAPGEGNPFHRLLGALLLPPLAQGRGFVLTAYQEPLALLEVPGEGVAIALLDAAGAAPDELRGRLDRLVAAPVGSVLYLVLVGGGEAARVALAAADRGAPDPNRLGAYHFEAGRLEHIAGRRLGFLRSARRWIGSTPPVDPAKLPEIVARVAREQEEAARFVETLQRRPARLTIALGSLCVLLYLASFLFAGSIDVQPLAVVLMGANSARAVIEGGEWWRLVSYGFLHQDVIHILVNMFALVGFGAFLEGLVGWRRYLVVYGLSIIAGGIGSAFIGQSPISVGASGGIWGLLGAGLGLMVWPRGLMPVQLAAGMRRRLLVLLGINVLISFGPRIDMWAHFAGGLVGFAFAALGGFGRGVSAGGVQAKARAASEHSHALAAAEPAEAAPAAPAGGAREPLWVSPAAYAMAAILLGGVGLGVAFGQPWRAAEVAAALERAAPASRQAPSSGAGQQGDEPQKAPGSAQDLPGPEQGPTEK